MPEPKTEQQTLEEQQELEAQKARFEEARKAGCWTRELANLPDGGLSVLGEATLEKLRGYARERSYRRK